MAADLTRDSVTPSANELSKCRAINFARYLQPEVRRTESIGIDLESASGREVRCNDDMLLMCYVGDCVVKSYNRRYISLLKEGTVSESIDMRLKLAALKLAESLNYEVAANGLNISVAELKHNVQELEEKLCLHVFEPDLKTPQLTEDGRLFIRIVREAVSRHE